MPQALGIAVPALLAALSIGTTAAGLAKGGGPKLPKPQPPLPAPAPPPVQPLPPPPTETQADEGVARERRKRQSRYGIANTLLTSPLGTSETASIGGRTLLGGG